MVLAAGLGSRMRPLTDTVPKPLVKLAGKPLIDHVLQRLADANIKNAIVNLHYKADMLQQHLAGRTRPKIVFSDERDALLDTGGGVVRALRLLGDAPFLIHNSDSVWVEGVGMNLQRLITAWDPGKMDSLMLLALGSRSLGYDGHGDFKMASDGRLERRVEREVAPFVFTGVSIAHPRMFESVEEGAFSLNRVWDRAIRDKRLYGVRLDGYWMHVGTPSALSAAEAHIADTEWA